MAKKKRNPARPLITLAVMIIIAVAALATGALTQRTSAVPELALDLQGGTQLILTPTAQEGAAQTTVSDEDLNQAITVIRKRIDASGVAESEITSQGGRNIVVSLPGQPDEETLNLVRSSAVMVFRPVIAASAPASLATSIQQQSQAQASPAPSPSGEASADPSASPAPSATPTPSTPALTPEQAQAEAEKAAMQAADKDQDGKLSKEPTAEPTDPSDPNWVSEQLTYDFLMADCTDEGMRARGSVDDPDAPVIACGDAGDEKYLLGPVELEGKQLTHASAGQRTTSNGQPTGEWVVNLEFNSEGAKTFGELSERLYGLRSSDEVRSRFAAVLDGNVISAPRMNAIISDGRAEVSGNFTAESARALANQLQFGSLPLNFTVESERSISATLGADHLAKGLWAGVVGLLLVICYLIWQYRGLSLIAAGSLGIAAIMVYLAIALLSWLMGYRLSLAGVAGLVIAIGITADSFIVYFERIRDEVRSGHSLVSAVRTGWKRAARTIIVSDMVNLLAAIVLYFLAVGGVQGFAFTLGLTTVVDLIVILMFTHPMMELLLKTRFYGQGHKLSGLDPEHLGAQSRAVYAGRGRIAQPAASGRKTSGKAKAGDDGAPILDMGGETIAERRRRVAQEKAAQEKAAQVPESASPAGLEPTVTDSVKED